MTRPVSRQEIVQGVRRVVLKIGSSIIASAHRGLDLARMERIAAEVSRIKARGYEVIVVSSGAIVSGMEKLGVHVKPSAIPVKQAAAAVGQSRLMWNWDASFAKFGQTVAQVLLTHEDFAVRARFLHSRNTLMTLLRYNVLPIINENDTVAVDEIRFGDNDSLAGMVIPLVDAHLLVILSDVDGLYTADPRKDSHARLIPLVPEVTEEIEKKATDAVTREGTGGMLSKVRTARTVSSFGVATILINGAQEGILWKVFQGEEVGTLFLPRHERLPRRKHWIAYTLRSKGRLILDRGAADAIIGRGKSLLPSGIGRVEGKFAAGDAVSCYDEKGKEIAKGLVNYSHQEIARICGAKTVEIARILGYKFSDEVIHRDNLVLL